MISILVTGRMGAGKDVFADYLVQRHDFVKTAFADGIRRVIQQYDTSYVPKSNRALEIDVGMTFRRWFGDDVWVFEALTELSMLTAFGEPFGVHKGYVISDGRFPREYDICVKERGFKHIHIEADDSRRVTRLITRDNAFDEELFDSPDDCQIKPNEETFIIWNNGTVEEFYAKIDRLIERLGASHE